MKLKELRFGMPVLFAVLAFMILTNSAFCQDDRDSVWVWYGYDDTINVSIGERVYLDFYVQTPPTAWVGDCHFCMGAQDQYIDSLLSHEDGIILYPFTEWETAVFLDPQDSVEYPEPMPEGWTSQSFVGISTFYFPVPWLHFETPTHVLTWVLHTANDSTNIGDDARAIGDEGRNFPQGPSNIGDTLGWYGYIPVETFSIFHFTGGGYIDGVITNTGDDPIEGVSIVNDLTGKETFSDENGEYHIGLYPGTHALTFSHPDYIEHTVENNIVVEDQTIQLDVVLDQPGAISGTVTDTEGDPIMGVLVSVAGQMDDTTDDEGVYSIVGLETGNYDVDFSHPDYSDTTVTGVPVQNNEIAILNITLNQFGAVTGVTSNHNGMPLIGVVVTTDTGSSDTTDTEGTYFLGNLDPGTYDITFSHSAYVETTIADVEIQFNEETILDVTLHQNGSIRGAVTDSESGDAIEGVLVLIVETDDSDTTNASGLYSLSDISPGIYEVSFSHADYDDTVVTDVEISYDSITMLDVEMGFSTGIDDNGAAIPETFSLNQNYPNPFNATTCIKYGLPENAHVVISVYDLLGRQVETLVNESQTAGYHQITWHAYDLNSGLYFYIIHANDYIDKKSMMLLK